jgi:anti-sigma regulatory factor (Ser/Thr protein kinase)
MPQNRPEEIKDFLLGNIPGHSRDIVPLTAKRFKVTPTTVHRHLNKLLKQEEVIKTGRTRGASYYLNSSLQKKLSFPIKPGLEEHQVWMDYFHEAFSILPENVYSICNYGFGEMFNNAIDHSQGTRISVTSKIKGDLVEIKIFDDGIGIFKKVKEALGLENERASILELTKGKITTDPDHHTGEGIFFTSRAVDKFAIVSSDLGYGKDNLEDDWFIETPDNPVEGTGVALQIYLNSNKRLEAIFRQYSSLDEEEGIQKFDKTHIRVELSKFDQDHYVSRSQAKRIMTGLEKFNHIVLDFRNIKTVGQGFVDEVFRIFQKKFPKIKIEYTHASEDVRFMIERGLPPPTGGGNGLTVNGKR